MSFVRNILLGALIIGGLAMGSSLQAQFPVGGTLRAHIPFSFMVGDRLMSAGDYRLSRLPSSSWSPFTLVLRSDEGDTAILETIRSQSSDPAPATALVMNSFGGQYYLSKIVYGGERAGSYLPSKYADRAVMAKGSRTIHLTSTGM